MALYQNVKKACSESGITVFALEKQLNFARGSIYKWDKNTPGVDKVKAVAEYFGCKIDDLVRDEKKTG